MSEELEPQDAERQGIKQARRAQAELKACAHRLLPEQAVSVQFAD